MAIWFINSKESLESILFMITLKGPPSIKKVWDTLHECNGTVFMPCHKKNPITVYSYGQGQSACLVIKTRNVTNT